MVDQGGLQPFLQQLKKQGLSKDEIIAHLAKKGVDRKKAEMVVDAYLGESESFSDLIQDIKIQKFTEEELAEIRKSLKSDLYHEESGLSMFGGKQRTGVIPVKPQTQVQPGPGNNINKEALGEIQALKKEMLQENTRLSGEIKRLDGEVAGLRELMKELLSTVREIRSMLK